MAIPMVLIYSVAGEPLLRMVFGEDLTDASDALPFLGVAMSLLACSYLSVQYLLAMGRASFLFVLGGGVVAEVALLLVDRRRPDRHRDRAAGIQAVCAAVILTMAMRQKAPTGHVYAQV